jgi:hypothetical protein
VRTSGIRTRRVVVAVSASLVAASSAATTSAAIRPGYGLAGVQLWMTEAKVRARLGPPRHVATSLSALGVPVTQMYYRGLEVDVQRIKGRLVVMRVLTTRRNERTASGVGVGSSGRAVRRLRGAHCDRRYCQVNTVRKPVFSFTMFWFDRKDRVRMVSISLAVLNLR